ncbi:MAG: copper resistance protein CopC [Rhodospirillales bacterium]|nr:copper resistance protein CopC [Rhodospirillales bacterium]
MRWTHLLLPAMLLSTSPAFAHAFLKSARPGAGAVLQTAPATVAITFTEAIEPDFTHIVVTNAAGMRVDTGRQTPSEGGDRLSVALKKLPAGTYTVTWHATSTDTHKTQGSYRFTVGH